MENPATWGKIRKVISETISAHAEMMRSNRIGLSLESMIYNALHNRGWLPEDSNDLKENYKAV